MTSTAKSLAIQYAQAKRQAQQAISISCDPESDCEKQEQQRPQMNGDEDAENNNSQTKSNNNNNNISTELDEPATNNQASLLSPTATPLLVPQSQPQPQPQTSASGEPSINAAKPISARQTSNGKPAASTFSRNLANQSKQAQATSKIRPKSTSMTNLLIESQQPRQQSRSPSRSSGKQQPQQQRGSPAGAMMQRPASRSALDQIHKGMNAKYASVQSKVLLQNIRPQGGGTSGSRTGGTSPAGRRAGRSTTPTAGSRMANAQSTSSLVSSERAQLLAKLKQLQEQLEQTESECETLRQETERDKKARGEQVAQLKQELQEKLAEHERQNEDQHQKLMEAYEMADQNRRAADSVLSESRQRDEESRKRVEELEGQLNELKEFVAMKEEMNGKLYELREQLREERERYEEQLKSLHSVFDNEKISARTIAHDESSGFVQAAPSQQSNYFNRLRNNHHSNSSESIGLEHEEGGAERERATAADSGCSKCRAGPSKLHKSEFDLYGSRLSTRMQSTAKSAWRSTKRLASSVVTSGVSLTACRHKSSSASMRVKNPNKSKKAGKKVQQGESCNEQINEENNGQENNELAIQQAHWIGSNEQQPRQMINHEQDEQFHTSVIKLEAINSNSNQDHSHMMQEQHYLQRVAQSTDISPTATDNNSSSFIHKDQNNKLTIVTKFAPQNNNLIKSNSHGGQQQAPSEVMSIGQVGQSPKQKSSAGNSSASSSSLGTASEEHDSSLLHEPATSSSSGLCSGPASASGGERSRCESASSGRGTSEDERESGGLMATVNIANGGSNQPSGAVEITPEDDGSTKRHKRRASAVFKASQLLPSANQLKCQFKSLFTPTNNNNTIQINSIAQQNNSTIAIDSPRPPDREGVEDEQEGGVARQSSQERPPQLQQQHQVAASN